MKIIYVTTSMDQADYKEYIKLWKIAPNPSNQNFHNKLIRALSISNEVEVISARPFAKELVEKKKLTKSMNANTPNIKWRYLTILRNKGTRYFKARMESIHTLKRKDYKNAVIITDTINPLCIEIAISLSKIYHRPLVGVATDSPSNITGTNRAYTMYLLSRSQKCSAMIALTEELNDIFNENHRPHYILEGVIENAEKEKRSEIKGKPYFFFGGALLEKYGVFNLVEAFKKLKSDEVRLVIAGHHDEDNKLQELVKDEPNIEFVGTLDVSDVLKYERNAIANINPRPFSEDLDRFSIPSKTIEYFNSGVPTITVRSTKLQPYFKDEAIFIKTGSPDDLLKAMKSVLAMDEKERKDMGKRAKEKAQSLYSLSVVNEKLSEFLTIFLKNR